MGLRINTNIVALAAQHKLQGTTKKLTTALERLSSGLRINKGSDDVVGLLKSESLRSQIRGIATAELNIANASNVLGVAEGSLAQLTDVAQRLRDYVVQAADASISATDRDNLGTIIDDLRSEFSRLVNAAEFDGVRLLDGSFTNKAFQVGPNQGDSIAFSIVDSRTAAIGTVAVVTGSAVTAFSSTASVSLADPAGIEINDISIPSNAFTDDGVSNLEGDESAISYARAINTYSGQTGVSAVVQANVLTVTYGAADATDFSSTGTIVLNGVTLDQGAYTSDASGAGLLVDAINEHSTETGITAQIDATTSAVYITAADGRNIDLAFTGTSTAAAASAALLGTFGVVASSVASFVQRGTFTLVSDEEFTIDGADAEFAASDAVTVGLDDTTTLDDLSVASATDADTGIFILDNVIRQLQTRRSDVGSKLIRFAAAEAELQTRGENLTASESRIRDADIAVEVANLTSAQILQQAGASVLSRANSIPQIALTLLQG